MKKLLTACVAFTLCLGLSACSTSNEGKDDKKTVTIGVVGENNEYWTPAIEALAKEGIEVKLQSFSDYATPNRALNDGEIDLNSFQHKAFFEKSVADSNFELSILGDTIIAPLGVYSSKHKTIDEIADGETIAIPSDATNGGRALKILEAAGLLTIDPAKGFTPVVEDITANPKNLVILEVEASQTASLLDDPKVGAAIINGAHAVDHNLNPKQDSIYLETVQEGSDNPYINILAVRSVDKDNETYKKVLKAFQSEETKKVLEETYKGAYVAAY